MQNLKDKIVIITGASSGIGETAARVLVQHGAKVVLSARREERLQKRAYQLGDPAVYFPSGVFSLKDMQKLSELAKSHFGKIDAVFANAGIMPGSNLSALKTEDWIDMINVNVKGVLNTIAAVLPEFIRQKRGHIIVTSSATDVRSVPGNAVYCGTKHFVRAMLDSFRMETVLEGSNIRTTTIYPGTVKTELLNTIAPSKEKTMVEQFYEDAGLAPDVIADAVLYALSQPEYVDGSDLIVRSVKES